MSGLRRLRVRELHPYLLCNLCGGYYVDATTIVECLHSFCKTCIVRYLESSKFCPICDVQVHKTKPLLSIRPDKTLQDIVYKLVPGLYSNEMCKRREFYSSHPETPPATAEDGGSDLGRCYTLPDDPVSLALYPALTSTSLTNSTHHPGFKNHVHLPSTPSKMTRSFHQSSSESRVRYLQCPAGVSVAQLKRLIRAKFGVGPAHPMALLTCISEEPLHDSLTLVDVAYITSWQRNEPLQLLYRIYEKASKKIKLDPEVCVADSHSSCEEMPKLEPSVGSGAPVCTVPQGSLGDYSTAPLLQAIGDIDSLIEERPSKAPASKALKQPGKCSERPTITQQETLFGKVSRAAGVAMDTPLKDSQVIQNCDSLLRMTQGIAGSVAQTGIVEPVVTYPNMFAAPSNGVSVGVALVPNELGLLTPTNVTCAIIPGAAATLPVLCGAGREWGVTGHQAGAQVVAAPTVTAAGEKEPQVPGEAGGSSKKEVSGGGEEGEEVQLKISESGVMSVCGKDTTVEGVLNSLESEAGELLSKIESGSLGEEFSSVNCPKNSEKKRSKGKTGLGQSKVTNKADDRGDKGDKTSLPGRVVEKDRKRPIGSSSRRDPTEAATTTTTSTITTTTTSTTTTATTTTPTTAVALEANREDGSINGKWAEATASVDFVSSDTPAPGEELSSCKEAKEEAAKSSHASHIPASLAAASMANLNKPLLKAGSSKVQQSEDKNKEQKLSNNGLSTKKEVRPDVRCPTGGVAGSGVGGCRRASHSYGYKTLKTPPKSWNPTISREHLAAGKSMAGKGPKDPPRPNKFFKARNRSASVEAQSGTGSMRPGVLKIDPKTLGPISAPVRGDTGTVPNSLPSQSPVLPPTPQVTTSQTQAVTLTLTPLQERCGAVPGMTPAVVPDTVEVPSTVRRDVASTPQLASSEGKESTNHSAKVVGTTNIQDNNTSTKTISNKNINSNSNNSNNNDNNNSNNNDNNINVSNNNYNNDNSNNNNKSSKSGKSLGSNSVNVSKNVKIQSVETQVSAGKSESSVSNMRTDKGGSKAAGIGVVGTPVPISSTSHSTQLKLAPCSTSCLTSQVPVDTVSSLTLPQLQPQTHAQLLPHSHTHHQIQPVPLSQHQHQPQSQMHPLPQHQSQPQLQTQLQPQLQLQPQPQHQSQPQLQPQPQIQPQPQQQLTIGSPTIGIIPSSGVSFTGAIGTLPLPYYTSPPLSYPTYPYLYQTPEAIGLIPPHSFFSPCLSPRSPFSSRTIGGPKIMSELSLQLPMMPVVSQGPNQAHSPRPMTPPSPRTLTPTQPPRPYPPHSPRQSCTNSSSRPHTPQSPKPLLAPAQSSKALVPPQSPKSLASAQSPKSQISVQSSKSLAPSHSPKSLALTQSTKPYTQVQSPKLPSAQSTKHPAPAQSTKLPMPAQSAKSLAPSQSAKPITPAQSPKPLAPPQSPKSPSLAQSPKSSVPSQSPKLSAIGQSLMPPVPPQSPKAPTTVQSPVPPVPPQSPKPPTLLQSPKLPMLPQSSLSPCLSQSPKPSVLPQSAKHPAPPQSPKPPTPAPSPLPHAPPQSPKTPTPTQSSLLPVPPQSPLPPAPPQSPKPPTSVQSPVSPAPPQSPKPPTSVQSPLSPAPPQSPKPSTSAQSPLPPAPPQSPKTPTPSQSPKPPVPPQSPLPPAPPQSPKPPISAQSPLPSAPPAPPQSPKPPAPPQSPLPYAPPQSPKTPTPSQSPKPPVLPQSPKPPTLAQSPKLPVSSQLSTSPAPAQSLMTLALQFPMGSVPPQSSMTPALPQSPMLHVPPLSPRLPTTPQSARATTPQSPIPSFPPQSLRPQIQSPEQLSAAHSVAIQHQPPKLNHTTISSRHSTTSTTQPSHTDKITPTPQQITSSLKSASQSSIVSSSGSSFCPQNSLAKSNVCLQTPASHPSALAKAMGNSFDISKPVLSQPTKFTHSSQLTSCSVLPITTSCLQSAVSLPPQTIKPARPHVTQSHTSLNSVHSISSQVTDKVSHLEAQQMMYQAAPSSSRHEFRKSSNNSDKTQEPRLSHNSSVGTMQVPNTGSVPLMSSSVFPTISVDGKGMSLAPATTFGSGYYPHFSLSSNCSPIYTDSIKANPLTSLAATLLANTTHTTSSLAFPSSSMVSLPMSLSNVATVSTIPSLASCPVLSVPNMPSGTAPSTLASCLTSSPPNPRSSASPLPASADSNKKTPHITNATDRLSSVVPSSCSSVVDTVSTNTTVAVTVSINATSNAITPVNTLATTSSSITNAEALLSCCTALATLPVIGSVSTLAVSSNMSLCTTASTTTPLSSVVSGAALEQSTAATLQRNYCSSAVSMKSIKDTAASIVSARTSPVTTYSGENTQRGSLAATATQEKPKDGGGDHCGAAAVGSDGSCIRPPVHLPATSTSITSNSSSSSVTTTSMVYSAAATGSSCSTAGASLPARKEAFPQSQNSGCSSSRGSVGEHSVLNVMESGGCEPQSSACTPVCDVTHVIDAKQQCAEPSVSSSGGPRPCLKS